MEGTAAAREVGSGRRVRYRASWIVPVVQPPIQGGWVEVQDGTVVAVGERSDRPAGRPSIDIDLPGYALLPSLVNAHTHLELSGLRGAVSPAETMPAWAQRAMACMTAVPLDADAIRDAVRESRRAGTGLVGDISNTLASIEPLVENRMPAVVFRELLGFDEPNPDSVVREGLQALAARLAGQGAAPCVRPGLAAHAPYSVSPGLFRAIHDASIDTGMAIVSVHLAESAEELRFLRTGAGAWRDILEARGRWTDDWEPFAGSPVQYLESLGWLGPGLLVAHGVHLTDSELATLARAGATLVTCPRSNAWTGAGAPPVDRFYASGVRVAVGTDSLASVSDLNVFAELAAVRALAPQLAAADILRSGTRAGAEALGYLDRGAIEVGIRDTFIAVKCPESVGDVEEYLVGGVTPDLVVWPDGGDTWA